MASHRSFFFTAGLGFLIFLWAVSLWILSSLPGQDISLPKIPNADKIAHFCYFAAGGFLFAAFLGRVLPWSRWKVALAAILIIAAIGAGDEIHQLFTPNRSGADVGDWTADCTGGIAGTIVLGCLYVLTAHRRSPVANDLAPQGD